MGDYTQARAQMVNCQLMPNDVTDYRILDAMAEIPRELFVVPSKRVIAYTDANILVSENAGGRYLMRPHFFAKLVQLADVKADDVVLVIGGGTGYSTAVLAKLAASVVMLEEDHEVAEAASANLIELGIENAAAVEGKLTEGCPSEGPFDIILIDGAVEVLPEALLAQLKPEGRLVAVEGSDSSAFAKVYQASSGIVGGRAAFIASAHLLPGFEKPKEFVF